VDSRDVPGWDGGTLDAAVLLDAHRQTLTARESYAASIRATGTQSGDVTFAFDLNASQQRVFATVTESAGADREAYLTPEQSVIRVGGDDPTYNTNAGSSVERQFDLVAAYWNDDYGIAFADSLRAFEYTYDEQTTFRGATVFRFVSTSTTLDATADATLLVDPRGIIRSAEFTVGETTRTHEFTAVGETSVSPPGWLDDVPQSTTEQPDDGSGDTTTVQDGDLVVDVEAAQWSWQFTYADSGTESTDELTVPVGRPVALRATSQDVHHALTVPAFETTADAKPGETDVARFTPAETGEVSFQCTEYCGEGHSQHTGTVVVLAEDEYDAWKDSQ